MAIADIVQRFIPDFEANSGKIILIDEASSSFGYVGLAEAGSAKSSAVWRIVRVYRQGTVYTVETAPGEAYNNIWDDRTTYFASVPLNNSYSLDFDGVNDYLDLGTTTFTAMDIGQAWSMSFWINVNNYASQRTIYGKATGDPYGFFFYITTGGVLVAHARTSTYGYTRTATTVLTTGVWHHVTVVYSGSSNMSGFSIYLNGVAESVSGTGALTTSFHTGQTASIGARGGSATFFSGYIDEASFWSKSLSASEITELYNSGQPSDLVDHSAYSNLTDWWRMGDGDTFPTILNHKSANNGTMTNMVAGDIAGVVP